MFGMKWQKLGIYLYFRIASQGAEMAPEPLVVVRYLPFQKTVIAVKVITTKCNGPYNPM